MGLFKNGGVSSQDTPTPHCHFIAVIESLGHKTLTFLPLIPPPCSLLSFQVEVEVESMDKAGNFIGWLHIESLNLSIALVENALSKVHFTAERSNYYKTLVSAEDACREKKEKVGVLYMLLCILFYLSTLPSF